MNIACVITAAGCSRRFGGDKLSEPVDGRPMASHIFDITSHLPFCARVAVVPSRDSAVSALAEEYGVHVQINPQTELGLSQSVRVGTMAVQKDADAILFAVGDQPYLQRSTLQKMMDMWHDHPESIIALAHCGRRGNPVIFPRLFFGELLELSGDVGGSQVIQRHEDALLLYQTNDLRELQDIDTKEDLLSC